MNSMSDELGFFKKSSIPLIKRIYPTLMANQILSVQPMAPLATPTLKYYLAKQDSCTAHSAGCLTKKRKKVWRDITDDWEPSRGIF
jgi:hypothetical protein